MKDIDLAPRCRTRIVGIGFSLLLAGLLWGCGGAVDVNSGTSGQLRSFASAPLKPYSNLEELSRSEDNEATANPIAAFTSFGTMIQAHPRGTYYASHSSVFEDDSGDSYHTFYCSSVKPFVPKEDPGWATNERNTFYGADAIRYERLDMKLNSFIGVQTFLVGALEPKPALGGIKTIKLVQSPCTSTTVKLNGQYYTFFESFTDGSENAQMVAVHVARSLTPGGVAEVLTTAGWQTLSKITAPWKPVIRSQAFTNYPAHKTLIDNGLTATRENTRDQGHGNFLWGVGVPSAVVRNGKIHLIGWDNVAYPDRCRLEKTGGVWQIPSGGSCGSMILATSSDGTNFTTEIRPDFPGGELKIINDPGSEKDGQFAIFTQGLSDELKAKNKISLWVTFFAPDLKNKTSWHEMATMPSRVAANNYWALGGIVAPRVAGNSLGEIAPFSKPTLLQLSLPRLSAYSNANSLAENREIFAWKFKFNKGLSQNPSAVDLGAPAEKADPDPVPVIASGEITKDSSTNYGMHLCGSSFTNNASIKTRWSHQNTDIWYKPNGSSGARAYHYIHPIPNKKGHPRFCVVVALTKTDVNNLASGKTWNVQLYQPSTNRLSAVKTFNSASLTAPPIDYSIDHSNAGWINEAHLNSDGTVEVSGWACAKNYPNSVQIHLYFGGPSGTGTYFGSFMADQQGNSQADNDSIAKQCQSSGRNYRFVVLLPSDAVNAHRGEEIFIHGINPFDASGKKNTLIGNSGNLKVP
jgi:hypothetical protein